MLKSHISSDVELATVIRNSASTSDFIASTLGSEAQLTRNEKIAVASLTLCLEHREAILLLVNCKARSTAVALMRPVFEACVRGCWIDFVATNDQMDLLIAGRLSTKLEIMANGIRKEVPALAVLSSLAKIFKEYLDDFTHGSGVQLARWCNPYEIAPHHTAGEMVDVLHFIDVVGLIACYAREKICQRPTDTVFAKLQEVVAGIELVKNLRAAAVQQLAK